MAPNPEVLPNPEVEKERKKVLVKLDAVKNRADQTEALRRALEKTDLTKAEFNVIAAAADRLYVEYQNRPELLKKWDELAPKLSDEFKHAIDALRGFGSGMLKTIAGYLGPESILAKLFMNVSSGVKAQFEELRKACTTFGSLLIDDKRIEPVIKVIRQQVEALQRLQIAKYLPAISFEDYVKLLASKLPIDLAVISEADIQRASEAAQAEVRAGINNAPATAPAIAGLTVGENLLDTPTPKRIVSDGQEYSITLKRDNVSVNGKNFKLSALGGMLVAIQQAEWRAEGLHLVGGIGIITQSVNVGVVELKEALKKLAAGNSTDIGQLHLEPIV